MTQPVRATALVPAGFALERVIPRRRDDRDCGPAMGRSSCCLDCGAYASRVHSRYSRRLGDLPLGGRPVRLIGMARRFRCSAPQCKRRVFTECFDDGAVAPWARRTARLDLLSSIPVVRLEGVLGRALPTG